VGLEGQYNFFLSFLVRDKNAPLGEHLVRARASMNYPSRSVSAEIELEPGQYEVLPKIAATKNADANVVEAVVKRAAIANPQKLRQIGLNYDIAHAKGGFMKEEKAPTVEAPKEEAAVEQSTDTQPPTKTAEVDTKIAATDQTKPTESKDEKAGENVEPAVESAVEPPKAEEVPDQVNGQVQDSQNIKENSADVSSPVTTAVISEENPIEADAKQVVPPVDAPNSPPNSDQPPGNAAEEDTDIWDPVAVVGLRVYSKDPQIKVTLVKPDSLEEASLLNIDGVNKAEATM
jgi:hypothetical protein